MVDTINLGNFFPPLANTIQPQSQAQASAITAQAETPGNTILSGIIVGEDNAGNSLLQTDTGTLSFTSNIPLPVGSEVNVSVQTSGDNTTGQVLTIGGEPPQITPLSNNAANPPEINSGTSPNTPGNAAAQTGLQNTSLVTSQQTFTATAGTVTGTLISQQAASYPFVNQAATGTQLTLKVVPLQNLATAAIPAAPTISDTAVISAENTQKDSPYNTYARPQSNPENFSNDPEASSEQPPSAATAAQNNTTPVQSSLSGQVFTAKIIGNTSNGETLIQSPLGLIRLSSLSTLHPSDTVGFEIVSTTSPTVAIAAAVAANSPLAATSTPITQLAQQWTALQQIFTLLSGRVAGSGLNAQLSNEISTPLTPNPLNANTPATALTAQGLSTGLMTFVSAVQSGNFKQWLGKNNVKWLEDRGHDDTLTKADSDFNTLAGQFNKTNAGHWQALFFPVAVEGQIQQVRLYVKQDKDQQAKDTEEKSAPDTRFVIEIDLSKLGEIQMDGFVKKSGNDVQFDMMIRSLNALPQDVQNDISSIYQSTGAITGYKGGVAFQSVKTFPINPMTEIATHHDVITA